MESLIRCLGMKKTLKIGIVSFILFFKCFLFANFKTNKLGIALGYSTREICSCLFIENRSEQECQKDYGLSTIPVKIEIDKTVKVVSEKFYHPASGELILMRSSQFRNNSCILEFD